MIYEKRKALAGKDRRREAIIFLKYVQKLSDSRQRPTHGGVEQLGSSSGS